jgi:hypothetical protein
MFPLLLAAASAAWFWFRFLNLDDRQLSPAVMDRIVADFPDRPDLQAKVAKNVAANPEGSPKYTNPVKFAAQLADAQTYSDRKVAAFNKLTPEQKRNYKGGF